MNTILDMCAALPERLFAEGETLLHEGEKSPALLFLVDGAVEILKQDTQVNTVSAPGSILGEVSVLLGRPHMATVRALQPTTCRVAEDGDAFLRDHPEANYHIARMLAGRLSGVTSYLVDLKNQFESNEDHLGMVDEVLESLLHHHSREQS